MLAVPLAGNERLYLFGGGNEKIMFELQAEDGKVAKKLSPSFIP